MRLLEGNIDALHSFEVLVRLRNLVELANKAQLNLHITAREKPRKRNSVIIILDLERRNAMTFHIDNIQSTQRASARVYRLDLLDCSVVIDLKDSQLGSVGHERAVGGHTPRYKILSLISLIARVASGSFETFLLTDHIVLDRSHRMILRVQGRAERLGWLLRDSLCKVASRNSVWPMNLLPEGSEMFLQIFLLHNLTLQELLILRNLELAPVYNLCVHLSLLEGHLLLTLHKRLVRDAAEALRLLRRVASAKRTSFTVAGLASHI